MFHFFASPVILAVQLLVLESHFCKSDDGWRKDQAHSGQIEICAVIFLQYFVMVGLQEWHPSSHIATDVASWWSSVTWVNYGTELFKPIIIIIIIIFFLTLGRYVPEGV